MPGLLFDTHALVWFQSAQPMEEEAVSAIAEAQNSQNLFVSPITAWEVAILQQHPNPTRRPNLLGQPAATWFRNARRETGSQLVRIGVRISLEAARVPADCDHSDPGDCYLIATARVRKLALVTRDQRIQRLASDDPAYLAIIRC
jgi:PIN domain nuclease of toxin-antitoxin system